MVAESAIPYDYPETELPKQALSFRVMLYGMDKHHKLFTARQLLMLTTLSDLVAEAREKVRQDGENCCWTVDDSRLSAGGIGLTAYADAVATYLGLGVDKLADYNCTLVTWIIQRDQAGHAMTKQALPMVWDFTEVNPLIGAAGDLTISLRGIARVIEDTPCCAPGFARQLDATAAIVEVSNPLISTDPPYYDNIGYADLSDFFYVWMRRSLNSVFPSLFSTLLTPKASEMIASPYRHDGSKEKAQSFFEEGFGKAFTRMRETHHDDFPLTVYYAFKQSESDEDDSSDEDTFDAPSATASTGWETMLTGLLRSGFSITGTWPIRTEHSTRSVGMGTNALASSIVLVCRPRPSNASLATRKDFMNALRRELPEALKDLQHGNIAPVDLAQAAIGPGMAVFTRHAKVVESDGKPMTVRTALGIINQVLDEVLSEQEGDFDPDTRWALAWFEQYGTSEGPYGVAETLSKAKDTAIKGLAEAGIVKAGKGKVQLLGRTELPDGWNPTTDKRLTVWETTQHLIRTLETKGEAEAAGLLNKLGGVGEIARELAYRLYSVCERKKWAEEALAYNGLVIAWPELSKLAPLATKQASYDSTGSLLNYGTSEGPYRRRRDAQQSQEHRHQWSCRSRRHQSRQAAKCSFSAATELPDDWNPATDKRLTVWETTQHLIRTLETKGEVRSRHACSTSSAASAETARDLAYRLYSICERKKWADEALAYNSLVIAWPELSKLALSATKQATCDSTRTLLTDGRLSYGRHRTVNEWEKGWTC